MMMMMMMMMMSTPGNLVVRDSGKLGVLTTGRPAVFNASGGCPSCCGGEIPLCCQQGYAVQMPGTGDRPGFALSLSSNMWATLWTGAHDSGVFMGLPFPVQFPVDPESLPLTGHSFTGSEEMPGVGANVFTKSCTFSRLLSISPELEGIIGLSGGLDGRLSMTLAYEQRLPGTGPFYHRLSGFVKIDRLTFPVPGVTFQYSFTVANPGDPVVFDWELTRVFGSGSGQLISISRDGMIALGIPYFESVVADAAAPGGLPTTCDLRIAYLPEMGGPLHPIFDDSVPFDLSPTFRYFDVADVFDVTEAPVFCPGVGYNLFGATAP
jgi:hypothetical protein